MKERDSVFLLRLISAGVVPGGSVGELECSLTNQIITVRIPEISVNQGQRHSEPELPAVTSRDPLQSQHVMSPNTRVSLISASLKQKGPFSSSLR